MTTNDPPHSNGAILIERSVYDAYQEQELRYEKLKRDYDECLRVNHLQIAKLNDQGLEVRHLRLRVQQLTCKHERTHTIKVEDRVVVQCSVCSLLHPEQTNVAVKELDTAPFNKVPQFPTVRACSCQKCGIRFEFKTPRQIANAVCQSCGDKMELEL